MISRPTVARTADDEVTRAVRLLAAQGRATRLFAEIEKRGPVAQGEGERAVGDRVRDLAKEHPVHEELLTLG